jgi:hypothetical protein
MTRLKLLSAAAILSATMASPLLAQDAMGPAPRTYSQPAPTYYNQGYYPDRRGYYRDDGFAPLDAAAGVAEGAVDAAGAIATAPFRAMEGDRSYAMMGDPSYCAQRYRSYDPRSGTFMGYDGQRHPC